MAYNVKFLKGTLEAYNGIAQKDENTFYYAGSDLFLGSVKLSNGADLAAAILRIAANESDIDNLQKDIEALTGGEIGSISGLIAEAVNAAKAELNTRIDGVEDRLEVVEGDYLKASDKTELEGKITTEKERALAAEKTLTDNLAATNTTLNEVKADVDAFFADADLTENAKDTLKEIQTYIDNDATAAANMTASIQANTKAIADEKSRAEGIEGGLNTRIGALEGKVSENTVAEDIAAEIAKLDATVESAAVETGKGLKVTVVETDGKLTSVAVAGDYSNTYDTKGAAATAKSEAIADAQTKANTAEQNAKDYADGLAGNYDAKGAATTAETNAKKYADELATNYDAAGSAANALKDAKGYADDLAGNYDAAGSASSALATAKTYAEGEADTAEANAKAYTDSALTWGTIA